MIPLPARLGSSGTLTSALKFVPDNTFDVGADATGRPSNIYLANTLQAGKAAVFDLQFRGGGWFTTFNAPGNFCLTNSARDNFVMLCLGPSSSTFPALKRNATTLQFRLGDDSDDAPVSCLTVLTKSMPVASLPAASTAGAGARAFVSDCGASFASGVGLPASGSGMNSVPVYSDGSSWIIG